VFTHDEILQATMARANGAVKMVTSVSTDSRTLQAGALFVALRGENYDGHQFVPDAMRRGAAAVMVESEPDMAVPHYVVDDTLAAYHALAAYHRNRFAMPVIGITGTNGKTTVKEMVAALLARAGEPLFSEGNYNNHVGVPMTLLRLKETHSHAVIEMGMNHVGEIAVLSRLAAPSVAVITNIGRGHLEFLQTVEHVLAAKLEILTGLIPGGTLIAPRDSIYFDEMRRAAEAHGARVISFGITPQADVRCEVRHSGVDGTRCMVHCGNESRELALGLPGVHNAVNAAAALAAVRAVEPAYALSSAAEVLARFAPVQMRCQRERIGGVDVIIDCYNANPESMLAALNVLATHAGGGRHIALLGEMHELGAAAPQCHYDVGVAAARTGVHELIVMGAHAADVIAGARDAGMDRAHIFEARDAAHAAALVAGLVHDGDCVVLKGSRRAHLEDVLNALRRAPCMATPAPYQCR